MNCRLAADGRTEMETHLVKQGKQYGYHDQGENGGKAQTERDGYGLGSRGKRPRMASCRVLHEAHLLRNGISPEMPAKGTLGYAIGLVKQYLCPHSFADLEQGGEGLSNLFLNALLSETAPRSV